ncbi:MAG: M36 family metallopeptidase, partial [Pirellulales bacterium]|nr:M36 family metallopeptidase [Pirellulales bacterium]
MKKFFRNRPQFRGLSFETMEQRTLLSIAAPLMSYLPPQYNLQNFTGFLSEPSSAEPRTIALDYLSAHAEGLGLTAEDFAHFFITDQYTDADTGVTHIYLRQEYRGLEVIDGNLAVNVNAAGCVMNVAGGFVPGLFAAYGSAPAAEEVQNVSPIDGLRSLSYALGLENIDLIGPVRPIAAMAGSSNDGSEESGSNLLAAEHLSLDPIPVKRHYVPVETGGVLLAWDYVLRTPDGEHWYEASVEASTGRLLGVNDWVAHASYNAYPRPIESPSDGARSIVVDPHDPAASPYGWHDTNGAAGAEYTDTRGNNVFAQDDTDANNTGGNRPSGGASLNFDFPIDFAQAPGTYQNAAITNLFYWNNLLHDIHYKYGFTEVAGNFQQLNYTGQGLGNDPVQADAQDGSGTNNANFATPPDGQAPRMQMYLFTYTSPSRDGDLDNEIIVHEYGHGVSNRLVGGPANASALTTVQSRGMGEGWSDWWALMFTQKPTDTKMGKYPAATYVLGQSPTGGGIRRYPYSFDMTVNPLTYGNIKLYPEVHDAGEVWCAALWDMNWLLIDKYGFNPDISAGYSAGGAGNVLALKLVMDSLKLVPSNPSYLQSRDAILLADMNLTGGANQMAIWQAFARRGMGKSAYDGGSSSSTNVTEAFDLPTLPRGAVAFSSHAYPLGATATITVSDSDLSGNPTCPVMVVSSAGDSETVNLTAQGAGLFTGTIATSGNPATTGDGILQTTDAGTITVTYNDANDGTGHSAVVTDVANTFIAAQVTATSPAAGSPFTLPGPLTFDITFSKSINPASVTTSSLAISGITGALVTGATVLPGNTTARFTLSGINGEGTLGTSIAAGAVTDASGNPCAAFTGSYAVDFGTVAFPVPLTAIAPLGALIYDRTTSGMVGPSGDTDTFTLAADPGQTLSILVTPTSTGLQSTVQLLDASGAVIGTATAAAPDQKALIQATPTAGSSTETYKIVIGGAAATTGNYSVQATLNAALEREGRLAGITNDILADAQDIDGSNVALTVPTSNARRGAVLGQTDGAVSADYYSFTVAANETDTLALTGLAAGTLNLELLDGSGALLATGAGGATNLSKVLGNHGFATAGTYYVRITGTSNLPYSLVVTHNAALDAEKNDTPATAQALQIGSGTNLQSVLGYLEPGITGVEPDDYAVGTALTNVVPGVALSVQGATATVTSQTASYHSTGTRVFARGTTLTWSSTVFLRADFAAPVSSVSLDLAADDSNDPGFLKAYNSAGVLLQDLQTTAPPYPTPGYLTMTITRPTADIAYVVAGGQSGQAVYLDHLVVNGGASGSDYYSVVAQAGQSLNLSTTTPADGAGEFANNLAPHLELYDSGGALVAGGVVGADGRNENISFNSLATAAYYVRVSSRNGNAGEYVLNLGTPLLVALPANAAETDGAVTGTVSIPAALAADLTVNLVSSAPGRVAVPASVTILAGKTSADVPLTLIDNALLDGLESVTITASEKDYASGIGTIILHDDETAVLSVALPAAAAEGDGVLTAAGTITASAAPARDIVVSLSSSDTTELTVPATVILRAGQTTAIFDLTVINDTLIDDTQTATVTAAVENWTSGSAGMDVLDNDRTMSVTLPASGWEGQTLSGTVQLGGALPAPLVVSLASDDTTELTVPASVTIPAGETSATFSAVLVANGLRTGPKTVHVTVAAAGFLDAAANVLVNDSDADHFAFATIAGPQVVGLPFSVTAKAYDILNNVIAVYGGAAALTGSGLGGTVSVSPATVTFASGVWMGNVTVNTVDPAVTLQLASAAGVAGATNAFAVKSRLQVASTTPAPNGTFTLPAPLTYEVIFSEPVAAASVKTSSLTLSGMSGATVSGVSVLPDNLTARFTLSGISSEGILTLSMPAGAVADQYGYPIAAFSASYSVDNGTLPFPVPLVAESPQGSLVYDGSTSGAIGAAGDTDSFTIDLDAGQTLTAWVRPAAGLQPTLSIAGPGGINAGPITASAAGKDALLQTVSALAEGTYTVTVGSTGGTVGTYTLQLTLNAALESEDRDGPANDTLATAQDLSASFLSLGIGAGKRGAVAGTLPAAIGTVVVSENFDAGPPLGPQWSTYSSDAAGRILVTGSYGTAGGAYALVMDTGSSSYNLNEAIWTVNLAGLSSPKLNFYHRDWSDESHAFSGDFTGHYNADGVAISADGATWHPVWNGVTSSAWTLNTLDLAAQAATHGIALGANFQIKFQQYDNLAITTDGRGFDQISITAPAASEDWYKFAMAAGDTATLALGAAGTNAKLELYNGGGTLLASGIAAANLSQVVSGFAATTAGDYYARVAGNDADYRLVVMKNASFDIEPNDTSATAQNLDGRQGVLGSISGNSSSSVTLNAIDSGWWNSTGGHTSSNKNYATGYGGTYPYEYRSYFVFDLTTVSQTIGTAQLNLFNPSNGYISPDPAESYALFDVSTPIANLQASGSGQTAIFDDLGTGMSFADKAISAANNGQMVPIILNSAGVAYLNALRGSKIGLGGALTTIGGTAQQTIYGWTSGSETKQLVLTSIEPGDWYSITVPSAGIAVYLSTSTPADGSGAFDNLLDPNIELYDPAGTRVANGTVRPDGRNESINYVAPIAGVYRFRVSAGGGTKGEYYLSLGATISVSIPANAAETDGTVKGTVSIPAALAADLVVSLTSSDPSRAAVPANVTIPAGQTSAELPIDMLDNAFLDGAEQVVITASTTDYGSGGGIITVHDDETAVLAVSLPAGAAEGDGVLVGAGSVTASAAPTRDIVVQLSSSDTTEVTVPATVILRAGQTTATFDVTIIDDALIDGAQSATVTAGVENWTSGSAS